MPTLSFDSARGAIDVAFAYHRAGDLIAAASVYDQILSQLPTPDPNIFYGYGTLLISQEKYGLGIALLQAAVQFAPECAPIWTNLGCAYKHIGADENAKNCYEKAYALEPNQPDILAGIGGFWVNKGEPQKVIDYSLRALEINPGHNAAHMHLALGYMEQGKYPQAWPHYEHRWETIERIADKRPYTAPRWKGEFVNKLAIHGEQGLGDEILFMSTLYKVRGMAEHIVIECAERLIPTFEASFGLKCYPDHKSLIEAEGEPDAYISMGSLPGLVGLPDGRPFLKRPKLTQRSRPKIGVAWKGGTARTNHKDRSITLDDLGPILGIPDVDFVSVQYGASPADGLDARGLSDLPVDFDSLHARIADCDLVITVCQTAVHQAGAMGVDCWVLVPEKAAWRYRGQEMMPWYKSVKFFRQEKGDWQYPIQMIAASLKERYARAA